MDIKKLEPEIDLLHEKVCTALGDTTRIMILYLLSEKPLCVNSISEELDIPQPTISRHLKVLRERDLVNTERQGTNIEYSLADNRIIDALDIMRKILTERIHAQAAITNSRNSLNTEKEKTKRRWLRSNSANETNKRRKMKILIIGGVAGGASTATRLRRMDEKAEIILIERGEYISFANCGLPYHIGEVIEDRDKLLVVTPQKLRATFNIDARVRHEALSIDREKKEVTIRELATGREYKESYDKLVLSPGASPIVPPIEGVSLPGVYTLRSLTDMDRIDDFLLENKPASAVVIGGGFIGLEIAENLQHRGLQVTIIEMLNQVMAPIDYEMAAMVHQHLQFKHVRLALGDGLKSISQNDSLHVTLQSGRTVDTDMVILSVGVRPETTLAKDAGLELGARGAIVVNEHMQTSDKDIYAIGDAVLVKNVISGKEVNLPLAGPASKQARVTADHITGHDVSFNGVEGTSIVKVFDLTVGSTGLNSKQLDDLGLPYKDAIMHASNHAGYYPGASPMAFKLLFSPEGKIYGAQLVGIEGVDKRVDVIATAIHGGMTVFDLEELELAYAPPYGSARDPVNIAGFVAGNILRGDLKTIDWDDVDKMDLEKTVFLDVREPEELALGISTTRSISRWENCAHASKELPQQQTDRRILPGRSARLFRHAHPHPARV